MQVENIPIYRFLEGFNKSFIIPVYQRDYAWKTDQCDKLWDDLIKLKSQNRPGHFLGTLVIINDAYGRYLVIDGQQRLTTVSILLFALHNYLIHKDTKTEDDERLAKLLLTFLINTDSKDDKHRVRLKPNKHDQEEFNTLLGLKKPSVPKSNILSNYNFYFRKIASGELQPSEIFDLFQKLSIILISLTQGTDDPQLIFESLNSTGVDLSHGDLIRNYVLMDLDADTQERLYDDYWRKIESNTNEVSEFIRHYLSLKEGKSITKNKVYRTFKDFCTQYFPSTQREHLLEELLKYAKIYGYLSRKSQHPHPDIDKRLLRLSKLELTVSYPYLMDLIHDFDQELLSLETTLESLKIIESYLLRRTVGEVKAGINKVFPQMAKSIKIDDSWQQKYTSLLQNFLKNQKRTSRFPNNQEFEDSLLNRPLYDFKVCSFVLECLENDSNAYPISIDSLTIEHIMPRTLTRDWQAKLGDNYEEVHQTYLHTLGNLTLTAKNTELSNKGIEEKQQIDYQVSRLSLNVDVSTQEKWGEEEIKDRATSLITRAKKIWPDLISEDTTISPPLAQDIKSFTLSEELDITGLKPHTLLLGEPVKKHSVSSWRDVLHKVLESLFIDSPAHFKEATGSIGCSKYFCADGHTLRKPIKINRTCYVEANLSSIGVLQLLRKVCRSLDQDTDTIEFLVE